VAGAKIEVPGLAALRRDLKQMPKDVQKAYAKNMQAVAKIVADDARSRVPTGTGLHRKAKDPPGAAKAGITAMGGSAAGVRESREPAYLRWLDFGSRTPKSGNNRAEGPWRGSGVGPKGGRFVYPAIEDKTPEIAESAARAVDQAAKEAGFH
jgi:hypothetical protein